MKPGVDLSLRRTAAVFAEHSRRTRMSVFDEWRSQIRQNSSALSSFAGPMPYS